MERCNVCGRELIRRDEKAIGCCAICANEEIPNNEAKTIRMRKGLPPLGRSLRLLLEKRANRLRKIEARWRECGGTECAAIYQGAASEIEILLKTP